MSQDSKYLEARDEAARGEHIYQPKYGGKDHSGYDTMMKYEINYERDEAFCNGADWGYCYALQSPAVTQMREALIKLTSPQWNAIPEAANPSEGINLPAVYCSHEMYSFLTEARKALAAFDASQKGMKE